MTATTQRSARRPEVGRTRTLLWRHPEAPWAAASIVAWVWLAVRHWSNHDAVSGAAWRFGVGAWTLMVIAMMVPGTLAAVRRLAFGSLWRRRHRNVAMFVGAYVGLWVALGVAAGAVVIALESTGGSAFDPGSGSVAAVLIAAAAWQFTGTKRRALRRCHLERPLAVRGRAADRSVVAYGLFHARACAWSCGPMMLAMFVAAHDFHLMVPLAAVSLVERYQTRPTEWIGAAALVATAALTLLTP